MLFSRPDADILVPDGTPAPEALRRTTHLCIGAHQDDIEIMAYAGIAECRDRADLHFTGVVASDGAGSPRTGKYDGMPDDAMRAIRREEQRQAATLGRYNLQVQLAHPRGDVKRSDCANLNADLDLIFSSARPSVVYLHNPADSHDTHVALLLRCLESIARLPAARRPARVLGCEVWRSLDWLLPADKVALDAGADPDLARKLLATFDSQVAGGKRYDEATLGRRSANATFNDARSTDKSLGITFAIDLTPVTKPGGPTLSEHTLAHVARLHSDIEQRLRKFS